MSDLSDLSDLSDKLVRHGIPRGFAERSLVWRGREYAAEVQKQTVARLVKSQPPRPRANLWGIVKGLSP